MEIEEIEPIDRLYRDFVHSGFAFGAKRWLASLQRACERNSSLTMTNTSSHDLGGGTYLITLEKLSLATILPLFCQSF